MIELRKNNSGAQRCELYAVEGSGGPGPGRALHPWLAGGFHRHEFCTRIRVFALTPNIQDKSRMREMRPYGSVRGLWATKVRTATVIISHQMPQDIVSRKLAPEPKAG